MQLTPEHGFAAARAAVPYLARLGISHLYLSPIARSRRGSAHGYDVTDPTVIDPELGGEAGFMELAAACRAHALGLVLDIVPNHMAVMSADNAWWMDVLENGPASRFAECFDIDWAPARASMHNRLLVPALADPLGDVLDRGGIGLTFDAARGRFAARHESLQFPLDPRSYPRVFKAIAQLRALPPEQGARAQLARLLEVFAALPPAQPCPPEVQLLRHRELLALQRELARLCAAHPALAGFIHQGLEDLQRLAAQRRTELLAGLLAVQPWRLAYWRVSGEEINYRRFFDINELAAVRVEERRVFDATHVLVGRLWQAGSIDGVRVDHADGLYDPAQYFRRLRHLLGPEDGARTPWIVAEKILGRGETLPEGWEVDGTTGYEFAALVSGWLMHGARAGMLERIFRRWCGPGPGYADIAYGSRKEIMRTSLAAEISGLATRLDRLAQRHHNTLDFTLFDLREAIVEVAACFPVYRTYIRGDGRPVSEDAHHIRRAVGAARSRKQAAWRALEFLERVLLGELADDPARGPAALEFTLKFQQVTAPVMAKGIEDTACYRYPCLLANNEVGADPLCRGITTEALHQANAARRRDHPRCLLATSTHDTKRGEDARWRLCVLPELAGEWAACLARWRRLRGRRRSARAVGATMEYLLLQSLLVIWPTAAEAAAPELRTRMEEYAIKAAREVKKLTSWLDPEPRYEQSLRSFVGLLLPPGGETGFHAYFRGLIEPVAYFGMLNGLAALVLKFTAPGIPDIYQGNELPALVLVDPDNRRQPDYAAHAALLAQLEQATQVPPADTAALLLANWRDGRLKLYVTRCLLALRAAHAELFAAGAYLPLATTGEHAAHLCAFARTCGDCTLLVVVARWAATLAGAGVAPPGEAAWGDSCVTLPAAIPAGRYLDVLTGQGVAVEAAGTERVLPAGRLLSVLPVTVLLCPAPAPTAATSAR
ncbi:MAG TPA: malto-oligosyltrehalose synthase [Steroidobacteraceae bacterium]|nr:malto-oligosyltrehalose synthase [Steroidobacteraceae bacterium]